MRTLQGGADSACYLHDSTRDKFSGRIRKLIQWIEYYLVHEEDQETPLNALDEFQAICREFGFRVHAPKLYFFLHEPLFCGRILLEETVTYDPQNLTALVVMTCPTKADELQQMLCAENWMRSAIPVY